MWLEQFRARACHARARPFSFERSDRSPIHDILAKLSLVGKDLSDYSLDTVKMFYQDARAAGFQIAIH